MSQPKQRQPRELLTRIKTRIMNDRWAHNWPWYRASVWFIIDELDPLIESLPLDPPKRSYYGSKGSLFNPHR